MIMCATQASLFAELQAQVRRLEGARRPNGETVSSGSPALDRLLPQHGLRRGTLTEWLADDGSGAVALALVAAREACLDGGILVVIDPRRQFYPPAIWGWEFDLSHVVF